MKPMSVWWRGIQLRIQLCDRCVKMCVRRVIDVSCDGHDVEKVIDEFSKHYQK